MLIEILGLRAGHHLRRRAERLLQDVLGRHRGIAVRARFLDDDGPRGGVAIRCTLTVTPLRGPIIRVEHTARTHAAAFNGAVTILKRRLKRRTERTRRRARWTGVRRFDGWNTATDRSTESTARDAAA